MSNKILNFINLHNGEELQSKVLENVKSNTSFRGANLWTLACAIVIASVGLNVNSTAVIIGAMLISPLMGPILGIGFALAIYDFALLKKSGKNLLIASLVSLLVATLYFFLSPFKETQSELLARTSPTIYDVIIAFFGGIVGVIAMTRMEKGNAIPGVAIATALMPPLCTAGYGLAIGNYSYFFGALYLYSINCFFICISTFLIIKYLNYTPVAHLNSNIEKRIRYSITGLIIILIVPSFYLAYNLYQEKKFKQEVENFISQEFTGKGYALVYKNINYKSSPKTIEIGCLVKKFTPQEINQLNNDLALYGLSNTKLVVMQDTKNIKDEILNELGKQNQILTEKDILIANLQNQLKTNNIDNSETIKEINILFPELKDVSIGDQTMRNVLDSTETSIVLVYHTDNKTKKIDTTKIEKWLSQKYKTSSIKILKQ